ncbi:hypothetical protein [Streptomyces sp. 2A115]|uniref:hypothetical protein n=1 Tax=Streptomyces sp. 2A115 TaxID=3457439 RepID=UPI003FCF74DA
MPKEKLYPCYTCPTTEWQPHRRPKDDRERNVIRKLAKKKDNAYVDDYWICVTPDRDCRNIRYAYKDNPFDPPVKMPEPE